MKWDSSFHDPWKDRMMMVITAGAAIGSTTDQKVRNVPAPSMRAATTTAPTRRSRWTDRSEDETELLNVVCSAGLWSRYRQVARTSAALVVRGTVEQADGVLNLVAEHVRNLPLQVTSRSRDFR